jgi:hypothetical protein
MNNKRKMKKKKKDGVSQTSPAPQDWPGTAILPISASQVARIADVSHQHPVSFKFFKLCFIVESKRFSTVC